MAPVRSGRRSAERDALVVKCTNPPKLSYRYRRLQHPDEFRLLVLAPGTSSESVDCKLVHTRMSFNPDYEALSYAWGDSSKPRQVCCNNRAISVTQSLYSALQHLRSPTKSRTIWADAICINQHINAEKNHQVAMMGKIYSQAERTLAWIGEEEDHIVHDAFDFLDRLDKWLCNCLEGYNTKTLGIDSIDMPQQVLRDLHSNWVPGLYRCLGPLFKSPWFKRLWIVQEVVLAKEVEVIFGTRVLSLDKTLHPVLIIGAFVTPKDMPDSFDVDALNNLISIGTNRKSLSFANPKRSPARILEILSHGSNFNVTDPRDKIHALLGLGYTPGFVADYSLSINDVFQNFAIWCLEAESYGLEVLSYAGLSHHRSGLASWVPTFSSDLHSHRLTTVDHFHASKSIISNSNSPKREKTWRVSGGSVLDLRTGYIDDVGTIARLPLKLHMKDNLLALKEILEAAKCNKNTLANKRYHELCQAMTAEVDQFGFEASPKQVEWSHQLFQAALDKSVTEEDLQSAEMALNAVRRVQLSLLDGKRFCLTSHDRFAWIPELSEVGDKICILQGARVPFVLRPLRDGKYALVGESWVQGLMNGEALSLSSFRWKNMSLI